MSAAATVPNRLFTREDYRAWCDAQPSGRFERTDGQVFAMGAERVGHVRMKAAAWLLLRRALAEAGSPCQALSGGVVVETGESDFEPDAVINCGPPMGNEDLAAPNPVVVVEVLSPGTKAVDTSAKLLGYFLVPSVAHTLIVDPAQRRVIHHRRTPDGIGTRLVFEGAIAMDPPGITIGLEELYQVAAG